jgi:hypothetical protein
LPLKNAAKQQEILYTSIQGEATMFKKFIDWFTQRQMTEIEYYIASRDPKTTADVEQLIQEFNNKRRLQCF